MPVSQNEGKKLTHLNLTTPEKKKLENHIGKFNANGNIDI